MHQRVEDEFTERRERIVRSIPLTKVPGIGYGCADVGRKQPVERIERPDQVAPKLLVILDRGVDLDTFVAHELQCRLLESTP